MSDSPDPKAMPGSEEITAAANKFFESAGEHCQSVLIVFTLMDSDRKICWSGNRNWGNDHASYGAAKEWCHRQEEAFRDTERKKLNE